MERVRVFFSLVSLVRFDRRLALIARLYLTLPVYAPLSLTSPSVMAAPAWPGVPDVFTFPSFSEIALNLALPGLGRPTDPSSGPPAAESEPQSPTSRPARSERAQELSESPPITAHIDSQCKFGPPLCSALLS